MKINKISWQNFRGLDDGEIVCNGRNVVISGRNGVGKSSIAGILPFVIMERIPSKSFDGNGFVIENCAPTATIEFDNVILSKTVTPRNQSKRFVNGELVNAVKYGTVIEHMTSNFGILMFDPFEFPTMNPRDQRDFLLNYFVDTPELASGKSPVMIKEELSSLRRDAAGIPYQIEELQQQLADVPDEDFADVQRRLFEKQNDLNQLRPIDIAREERLLRQRINELAARLENLKKNYHSIETVCPTCGQNFPKERVESTQNKIIAEGTAVKRKWQAAKDDLEVLLTTNTFDAEQAMRMRQLQDEVHALIELSQKLQAADKIRKRIDELVEREKSVSSQVIKLEGELAKTLKARQERLASFEQQIDSQFEFVKFKLSKLQANGEVKADCVPLLNGVPYPNLSKGERLKVALDIMRTIQRKAKREMPLFIDDAESYTSNSFVDLPNQLFLFKVTDSDLKIEVS